MADRKTTAAKRNGSTNGTQTLSAREYWRAVQRRERSADGAFVYAVRSTGIYCRPSCPSRKPSRGQVLFFALPEAAEEQGFRACLRCKPGSIMPHDKSLAVVRQVCREIEAQIANGTSEGKGSKLSLPALGEKIGMSRHQIERAFRRAMGITPRKYADAHRMRHLKHRLKKGDDVTTALYEAGYGSSSRVYERAPEHLGMTPATYRAGGAGMQIRYTIADSPLGRMLVGATDRGISALYIGDSDSELQTALLKEYPRAEIRHDRSDLGKWLGKILAHLRGKEPHLDLPTDVQATAFQRRVWEELRKIPYGKTRTYSEVARAIGKPSAIRAVARACATNPVSVVVPCHRVVRKSGDLAGYRWGIERKRALLEREQEED